jgi:hypothetical protein
MTAIGAGFTGTWFANRGPGGKRNDGGDLAGQPTENVLMTDLPLMLRAHSRSPQDSWRATFAEAIEIRRILGDRPWRVAGGGEQYGR